MPPGIASTIASGVCACNSEHIWAHLMQLGINYFIFVPSISVQGKKKRIKKGRTNMQNYIEPLHLAQNEWNYG